MDEEDFQEIEKKVSEYRKLLEVTKKQEQYKIYAAVIAVAITSLGFVDSNFLHNQLTSGFAVLLLILLGSILLVVMLVAGFAVLKALVRASAGLTLLIFLGQTYCALPVKSEAGLNALTLILGVGFLYLTYQFLEKLFRELKKHHDRLGADKKTGRGFFVTFLTLLFCFGFLWAIYLVLSPIIFSLCIYR